jgi:hypothetical protein
VPPARGSVFYARYPALKRRAIVGRSLRDLRRWRMCGARIRPLSMCVFAVSPRNRYPAFYDARDMLPKGALIVARQFTGGKNPTEIPTASRRDARTRA